MVSVAEPEAIPPPFESQASKTLEENQVMEACNRAAQFGQTVTITATGLRAAIQSTQLSLSAPTEYSGKGGRLGGLGNPGLCQIV